MSGKIGDTIFNLIISAIFTLLSGWVVAYFFNSNSVVTIGEPTKIAENQFITQINLNAFKDINKLRISIPINITEEQIKSNEPINIKLVNNNIGTENGSVFEVEKVPSNSNVELTVVTNMGINDKKIVIYNGNNVDVNYTSNVVNPVIAQRKSIITNAILYAIILGCITFWSDRRRDKKIQILREENDKNLLAIEDSKKQLRETKEELNKFGNTIEQVKMNMKKQNILLLAKLNDYRKELNFWRNTIRKFFYQLPDGQEKAEKLVEVVSASLKTYQTNEKNEHDFETLRVLSEMIKDVDENRSL